MSNDHWFRSRKHGLYIVTSTGNVVASTSTNVYWRFAACWAMYDSKDMLRMKLQSIFANGESQGSSI